MCPGPSREAHAGPTVSLQVLRLISWQPPPAEGLVLLTLRLGQEHLSRARPPRAPSLTRETSHGSGSGPELHGSGTRRQQKPTGAWVRGAWSCWGIRSAAGAQAGAGLGSSVQEARGAGVPPPACGGWMRGGRRASLHGRLTCCQLREPPKGLPNGPAGKDPACQRRRRRRRATHPWAGKIPQGREWEPTPVSRLENSMDRGTWRDTVHEVTRSWV